MLRRVLAPLTRMTVTTRDIAAGNFAVRVPAQSADEVGELARAFNRMAASLEQLERLRRTLMIDVAHELRTPLTNIRGYLEALTTACCRLGGHHLAAPGGNPSAGPTRGRRAGSGTGRRRPGSSQA